MFNLQVLPSLQTTQRINFHHYLQWQNCMPATEKLPKKHVKCVPIGSVLVYLDPALGLVVTSGSCQGAPAAVTN